MSQGRTRTLYAVAGILGLFALILGVALAMAIAYPKASRALFAEAVAIHPSLTLAVARVNEIGDALLLRAQEGWEYRFVGTYRSVIGVPVTVIDEQEPHDTFPEQECLECHPYFRERPLFSVVYFSHESHAPGGSRCTSCHVLDGPLRCVPPKMSGCGECHIEVSDGESCNTCHPYGSLFHGAALAGDREIGTQCVTCHLPARLVDGAREMGLPALDAPQESCRHCHQSAFCGSCHPSGHQRTYARSHAAEMREGETTPTQCYGCHSPRGCVSCHSGIRR